MLFSPFITFKYRISRRFGQPHLFPTRSKATLYNVSEEGDAPPEELSYEDALLDAQLRLFMRADYGGAEPPTGQYAQVERLISQDKEADGSLPLPTLASLPSSRPFLPPLTTDVPTSPFRASRPSGRFYRFLTGTASARLLPGGIALALTMMVLGSNVSQLLRSEYGGVDPTPVPPQPANEIYIYDDAEDRIRKRRPAPAPPTPLDTVPITIPMPSQELLPY